MKHKINVEIESEAIIKVKIDDNALELRQPIPISEYGCVKQSLETFLEWFVLPAGNITVASPSDTLVDVSEVTLKVERQNAKAMVEGFVKDSNRYYVSIFTAHSGAKSIQHDFYKHPKLIENTVKTKPRKIYPLSQIGQKLNAESYEIPKRYIAVLDRIFHIKNEIKVWEELCNNGIFDIWEPEAPYNSLKNKKDPMILVLRIFQIDYDFSSEIDNSTSPYFSIIPKIKVSLIKPIIPYGKNHLHSHDYKGVLFFKEVIDNIRASLIKNSCLENEQIINDTEMM